jgi:transcriptional regulator with XRE-family HTH domain
MEPQTFGEKIKQLRKGRKMTQEQLGEAVGLSCVSISKIEANKILTTADKIAKLADFFNVSVDWLLGCTDKREVNR